MVAELSAVYEPKSKTKVKVLDFVQSGGPTRTVLRTFRWAVPL